MQVCAPPGQFATWVHAHPIYSADDAKHLPLWQHFPAPYTGTLGNMFHASYRFLGHVQSTPLLPKGGGIHLQLPFTCRAVVAALVLLARDHFAEVFIELKGNTLLLGLLALLLIVGVFLALRRLEHFRLHLEQLIQ